jgi:hypothetical protein
MPKLLRAISRKEWNDDLKVAVNAATKIALDDAAGPGHILRHNNLSSLPWQRWVRVVAPPVNQLVAFQYDGFEIALLTAEVTLNETFEDF